MSAITVAGLQKRYGDIVAVDDVSLDISEGEIFVVLGRNGAGKTTTLEIIEGLREPDEGSVRIMGTSPTSPAARARIGVMPQRGDLYAGIRVGEALRLFAAFYERPRSVDELLDRLDLGRVVASPYRRLSGGEKRRLSLALALIGRPRVAFLDEPTAEMDVEGRAATWALVRELKEDGVTVVVVTHELRAVEAVADRVGILHEGRLVALGPPADLTGAGATEITLSVDAPVDTDALGRFLDMRVDVVGEASYRLAGGDPDPHLVSRLTTWLAARGTLVRTLRVGGRSLEDVYLEMTR